MKHLALLLLLSIASLQQLCLADDTVILHETSDESLEASWIDSEKEDYQVNQLQKKVFDNLYKVADIPFLSEYKPKILDLIEKGEKQPNLTIGTLVSVVVIILTVFFKLLFGGKKKGDEPGAPPRRRRCCVGF